MHDTDRRDDDSRFIPPPPPCEQVGRSGSASDVSFDEEPGEAPLSAREGGEKRPVCAAPSSAADARQSCPGRPSRRIAVIVAAACLLAVAAVVSFAAMAAGQGGAASDERAIDPQPSGAATRVDDAAPSAEARQAQQDIASQLSALAADEDGALEAYVRQFIEDYDAGVDAAASYGFSDLGISSAELTERLAQGLAFSIVSADVYGDKAWIEVSVTSKSFSDQSDIFAASISDAARCEDAEQYKQYLKERLLEAFDRVKPRTASALVVVERGEEEWMLSSDDIATLLGEAWYG